MTSSKKIIVALLLVLALATIPLGHSAWTDTVTTYPANQTAHPGDGLGFTWIVTTATGASVMNFYIQWGDGGTTTFTSVSDTWDFSANHVYSSTGQFTITVRADDYAGNSGIGGALVTIVDPPPSGGLGGHCCPKPV